MKRLIIIGAGHAGTSAALAAARQRNILNKDDDIEIVIINNSDSFGIRPRYYEFDLESTQLNLENYLNPLNVKVIIGSLLNVDSKNNEVVYKEKNSTKKISFDSLIISLGSKLNSPNIPGIKETYNIDTYESAINLRSKLIDALKQKLNNGDNIKISVLGGGTTGLELAFELPITINKIEPSFDLNKIDINIIDRNLVGYNIGMDSQPYLLNASNKCNVNFISNANIVNITKNSVELKDNINIESDIIVSCMGMVATSIKSDLNVEKDHLQRLYTNDYLQLVKYENIFSAGDINSTLKKENMTIMSCQQAVPKGKFAGYNAINVLCNEPLIKYKQEEYVTCVDLGNYGAILTEGWSKNIKYFGKKAKEIKKHIMFNILYPPTDATKETLLELGKISIYVPTEDKEI